VRRQAARGLERGERSAKNSLKRRKSSIGSGWISSVVWKAARKSNSDDRDDKHHNTSRESSAFDPPCPTRPRPRCPRDRDTNGVSDAAARACTQKQGDSSTRRLNHEETRGQGDSRTRSELERREPISADHGKRMVEGPG
jgi:hypothetical protein